MHIVSWSETVKGSHHTNDISIDGRVMLKMDLNEIQ
jgi:hypothetical protein